MRCNSRLCHKLVSRSSPHAQGKSCRTRYKLLWLPHSSEGVGLWGRYLTFDRFRTSAWWSHFDIDKQACISCLEESTFHLLSNWCKIETRTSDYGIDMDSAGAPNLCLVCLINCMRSAFNNTYLHSLASTNHWRASGLLSLATRLVPSSSRWEACSMDLHGELTQLLACIWEFGRVCKRWNHRQAAQPGLYNLHWYLQESVGLVLHPIQYVVEKSMFHSLTFHLLVLEHGLQKHPQMCLDHLMNDLLDFVTNEQGFKSVMRAIKEAEPDMLVKMVKRMCEPAKRRVHSNASSA